MSTRIARRIAAPALALAAALVLSACSNPSDGGTTEVAAMTGTRTKINPSPDQKRITTDKNGTYAQVLKRWGLSGEAVKKSEINTPGLPKTNK